MVGAGIVGARAARELLGPGADGRPTTSHVALSTRRPDRRDQLRSTFGDAASVRLQEGVVDGSDRSGPADVVIVAREPRQQLDVVRAALDAGSHVIATTDDPDEVEAVLRFHPDAVRQGRFVTAAGPDALAFFTDDDRRAGVLTGRQNTFRGDV